MTEITSVFKLEDDLTYDAGHYDLNPHIGTEITVETSGPSAGKIKFLGDNYYTEGYYEINYKRCYGASLDSPECTSTPDYTQVFMLSSCVSATAADLTAPTPWTENGSFARLNPALEQRYTITGYGSACNPNYSVIGERWAVTWSEFSSESWLDYDRTTQELIVTLSTEDFWIINYIDVRFYIQDNVS